VKHWTRIFDLAVIVALSLLIVATLVHAAGLLPSLAAAGQAQTALR
jgi:hypothetical protein